MELTDDNTGEYIGIYRIIPTMTRKLTSINEVQYELEHVLATLLNDVLFKYHQRTNLTTRENIEYVLARQSTKHWRLGDCDFSRKYHYKWENENGLLGPLFSITEPFDVPYVWSFDTRTYPWTLNLKAPSNVPTSEIRFGKNLAEIEREVDPSNIVNRLYALGYGEGVNQLTIEKVNGGSPYIENTASIAEYGLAQYVWVDRKFEDPTTLLASAKAFLAEWSVPRVSYSVKAVDLSSLTGLSIDKFTVGKVVRIIDPEIGTFTARIVSESKPDIYGAPSDIDLEIANTKANVGSSLADVERRQEINEVYAQGATNMLIYSYEDNADSDNAAIIRFKLPDEMVRINKLQLTYETAAFRAYSRAIAGGGAVVSTTSSGGGSTESSAAGGDHTHVMFYAGGFEDDPPSFSHYRYYAKVGGMDTAVSISAAGGPSLETYGGSGDHTHSFDVPAHAHDITLPAHTHEIEYGIFKLSRRPSKVTVKVDGVTVPITALSGDGINLIPYLSVDSEGRVQRGWHTVEITPNDLGRINAEVMTQFFMQSRGGVDA